MGYLYGWLIFAAGLFFVLLMIVMLSPLNVEWTASRINHNDHAEMHIRGLYGFINYNWKLPVIRLKGLGVELKRESGTKSPFHGDEQSIVKHIDKDTVLHAIDEMKQLADMTEDLLRWAKFTVSHIKLTEWRWRSAIGSGDAVWTAMLTGAAWSIKGAFLGVLSQLVRLQAEPQIAVHPVYNQNHFESELHTKATMRFGIATAAIIFLLYRIVRTSGVRALFSLESVRRTLKSLAT
ncbi:DUF2953 domain-containing protein [Paenibacillus sp. GCM10027626]|uniref:DUF2953 domain-containing protein n=1 Tax=Paenibacillus sp. GCM10027626 TaxID=3273411 RepID=UPI003633DB7E